MKKLDKPIYVTQPSFPDKNEFISNLNDIWESKILTNNGPFHQKLEQELCDYLGVKYISLFSNGTLALITALQVLKISGEVITTPFSFVATTHSLWWNGIKPVFSDIHPLTCNLDTTKIESAITSRTTAIMPVHVYGNPCEIEEINRIAHVYGLKVIYDAAHAFGIKINGTSVLNYGDLSILSFHATKVFNTIEGGAIVCHDAQTKKRIDQLKNFGFVDELTVVAPGINAKMNEVQAVFGLNLLKNQKENINKRKTISDLYRSNLSGLQGIDYFSLIPGVEHNYGYFPVLINKSEYGLSRDEVYEKLKSYNINSRRYFYPLISNFPTYKGLASANPQNLPVAESIAKKVLCLPIYHSLDPEVVTFICNLLRSKFRE